MLMKNIDKNVVAAILVLSGLCPVYIALADAITPLEHKSGYDMKTVERGRYLLRTSGCNDCHTAGYLLSEGKTPEALWLTGDTFGWRGPWGTTYGSNLRLLADQMTEEQWVAMARTLKRRPPMPWFNLNAMTAEDLGAMYQFLRYLGPAGTPAPAYVPPDQEPPVPYATFPAPPG
jgi:mono/diheme cytochrome c family protein